jgi:hypothetical protein
MKSLHIDGSNPAESLLSGVLISSVCLGSFVVSFIHNVRQTLKTVLNEGESSNSRRERGGDGYVLLALGCLEGLVERAMAHFNKYDYSHIASYDVGFIESAQKVTSLLT